MKRSFLVAQLGARMHYAVSRSLHGDGQLETLFTDVTALTGFAGMLNLLQQSLLPATAQRFASRRPDGVLGKRPRHAGGAWFVVTT